jgi:hypothetical protein
MLDIVKTWALARIKERTSWDGVVLMAAGVVYLVFEPIASIVAYLAIGYGAWTLWKKEKGE